MNSAPEGRKHKLWRALERLETIQPSDVPELAHGWLEALNDDGLHAPRSTLDTAGRRIIKPTKDEGPVKNVFPANERVTDGARTRDLRSHNPMPLVLACPAVSGYLAYLEGFWSFRGMRRSVVYRSVLARLQYGCSKFSP